MADIRIKDLATLESASLTGDVFVIDGTTGTRKLSAFSPTFGGNATVTGTLTVNGGSADLGTGHGVKLYVNNAGAWANKELLVTGYDVLDYTQIKVPGNASNTASIKLNQNGLATFSGNILVSGTTASTTTSTGALVVSGGVGVAGAVNAGGTITSTNGSGSGLLGMRSSSGNASYVFWSETGVADRGILGFNNGSSTLSYRSFSSSFSTGTEVFSITSAGVVSIPATTASTSTSSGALVVSGGVGVAGNVWTGGQVNLAATSVEASTGINFGVSNGASRDLVFFGDGTRGGMLRGYHDGSNIARLGFGFWASSGDTYTSVIDITGSATASSQLVAIAGTASSTSTTSGALTVAGGMGVVGAVNAGTFYGLVDGVTAPGTESGYARIYVDSADGDLKVKFGDGTVKTIATDS